MKEPGKLANGLGEQSFTERSIISSSLLVILLSLKFPWLLTVTKILLKCDHKQALDLRESNLATSCIFRLKKGITWDMRPHPCCF